MLTTLNSKDGACAQIAHHGGQVISWKPANQGEQLFLSKTSSFDSGQAIRGGVPIIFPQFAGLGALPKHGFARNQLWQLRPSSQSNQAGRAVFELRDNPATQAIWPFSFLAELVVSVSGNTLAMDLSIKNTGLTEIQFTVALHTYLRVADIADVRIHGLQNVGYQDFVSGDNDCVETSDSIVIQSHTDRLYRNAPSTIEVRQPQQRIVVQQSGFTDVVVWNPWRELGASLADLEPDGYQRMVCVESAAVVEPVKLAPDSVWRAGQHLSYYPS
jgi:glucose-6-phosphate 1-epimerase